MSASDIHTLEVHVKAFDDTAQVMAGVMDRFTRTADGLTRSMRGVTQEFGVMQSGMMQMHQQAATHVGKGVSESFTTAGNAVKAFAASFTGISFGLGAVELARKAGEIAKVSSICAAISRPKYAPSNRCTIAKNNKKLPRPL
jgi:hypothetical protein